VASGRIASARPERADWEGRDRISRALVALVGSRGFQNCGLEDVLEVAGVDECEFHRHFSDMENCFLSVWDELAGERAVSCATAYELSPSWRFGMRAVARARLDFLRADRNRARFLLLEVLKAGEAAQVRRDHALAGFAALVDEGRRELEDHDSLSPAVAEYVSGAVNEMLTRWTRAGTLFEGTHSARELMYVIVRPYLGHAIALEELRATDRVATAG
jgi:AcrR family transcriptional regulator